MGDTHSAIAAQSEAPPGDSSVTANGLTDRHFVLQDERPDHLVDVDLVAMDPYLRGLLFTDGTVTRTLEVQALSPISVKVTEQEESPAKDEVAKRLEVPAGTAAIQRRVTIGLGAPAAPVIWAESHIVPDRLPAGFLAVLDDSPDGIGQSLQQVKLESWREMLWFGLDSSPEWSQANEEVRTVLLRLYRVIMQGKPAMLISESFAIEQTFGSYHLASRTGENTVYCP
jgi:chorismate-pyruvate lyase